MQMEVKLVVFSPTTGKYAVDIYINGKRAHCGRGFAVESLAMFEAIKWLKCESQKSSHVRWRIPA